jgi:hypothetical protein
MKKNIDISNELYQIKHLIEYNRSENSIVKEDFDDFAKNVLIGPVAAAGLDYITDPSEPGDLFYRQKFSLYKGYFDPEMPLGEAFDIVYFTKENANAIDAMNLDDEDVYEDKWGNYILGRTETYGQINEVKIYLPEPAFFSKLIGIVKSFTAYETLEDQAAKRNPKQYTLMYQLIDATKALVTEIIGGTVETTDINTDPSRGWAISPFGGGESGYFRYKQGSAEGSVYSLYNQYLPSQYMEYSTTKYGQEFAKSRFDQWYDSNYGQLTFLLGAILLSIITGGIASVICAEIGLSVWATRAVVLGVELAESFLTGIAESVYLQGRGDTSGAALCLLFSLFPLVDEFGTRRLAGYLTENEMSNLLADVTRKADGGYFKTPGDFKKWRRGLPAKTGQFVDDYLQAAADIIPTLERQKLVNDIKLGLKTVIAEITTNKGVITEVANLTFQKFVKQYPTKSRSLARIGINLGLIFATIPIVNRVVEDDDELKNDPQGLVEKADKTAEKLGMDITQQTYDEITKEIQKLQEYCAANPTDFEKARELMDIVKYLGSPETLELEEALKNQTYKALYEKTIADIYTQYQNLVKEKKDYAKAKEKAEATKTFFGGEGNHINLALNGCPNLPKTNLDYSGTCELLKWVSENKKDFTYEVDFGKYGGVQKYQGVYLCEERKKLGQTEQFVIDDCEVKSAFKQYGAEFMKPKPFKYYFYSDVKKEWIETDVESYFMYMDIGKQVKMAAEGTVDTQQQNTTQPETTQPQQQTQK